MFSSQERQPSYIYIAIYSLQKRRPYEKGTTVLKNLHVYTSLVYFRHSYT